MTTDRYPHYRMPWITFALKSSDGPFIGVRQNTGGHPKAEYEVVNVLTDEVLEYHLYFEDAENAAMYHAGFEEEGS